MAASHSAAPRRRVSGWVIVRWSLLGLVVALVLVVAWVGIRGLMAKSDLDASVSLASTLRQQLVSDDVAGARTSAKALQQHADSARDLTGDPVWRLAEVTPLAGPDLTAVRQVSAVLSDVSDRAVVPLADVAGKVSLSHFKPVGGSVDVQPLVAAQPVVASSASALQDALAHAERIDTTQTVSQVDSAVAKLVDVLGKAAQQASAADNTVRLLPAMIGADGPKNYVVLFQNNAELRAGGGIPGAVALVHAENGRLSLLNQTSGSSFPKTASSVLPLPVDTEGLYGAITGQYMQDVTLTPQFPLSAQLAREFWKRQYGLTADGVISIDPVALSYLLSATGPIPLPTGDTLTSANAVKLLLSDTYARYPSVVQKDAFFASAAAAVFHKISTGEFDPKGMIAALAHAGSERRVLIWSADPAQQKVLATTTLSGTLPVSTPAKPAFGVYLDDATGAKMDYYLDVKTAVGQAVCRKDGRATWTVQVTLTSTAPANAASALPAYVTGGGTYGVPPGSVRTNVSVYAPPGSLFTGSATSGADAPVHTTFDSDYPVGTYETQLAPGQSSVVTLHFLSAGRSSGKPVLTQTPVIDLHPAAALPVTCGSMGH